MYLKNVIYTLTFLLSVLMFFSNSTGVPQAVTRAPGEPSNLSCNACHSGGNFNPTISLLLKDTSGTVINNYEPGKTYNLEVTVVGVNSPKSYGFQMVSLAEGNNVDVGVWSNLGNRVKVLNPSPLLGRKYLVQSSPKQDGVFTMDWTAPQTNIGNVNFYFSGLAVNLNGNTNGDSHAVGSRKIEPLSTSSVEQTESLSISLFPNPSHDYILLKGSTENINIKIYDQQGNCFQVVSDAGKRIDISWLNSGLYFVVFQEEGKSNYKTTKFIKQ